MQAVLGGVGMGVGGCVCVFRDGKEFGNGEAWGKV